MEAYKNHYGTILINDPDTRQVKVWRNFWGSFRVYLGLHIVGFIASFIVGITMGLASEEIKSFPKPRQSNTPEVFGLSNAFYSLGSIVGSLTSPFIINWYLRSQAKKRWVKKYGSRNERTT